MDSKNLVKIVGKALISSLLMQTQTLGIWRIMAHLRYGLGSRL